MSNNFPVVKEFYYEIRDQAPSGYNINEDIPVIATIPDDEDLVVGFVSEKSHLISVKPEEKKCNYSKFAEVAFCIIIVGFVIFIIIYLGK
jgi:hypothetical protein